MKATGTCVRSVPLGRTGLEVGRVGLGTMNFGGRTDEAEARAILDRAMERGVTLIDTANVYGHDPTAFESGRGRSEEIIGRWLRDRPGTLDRIVLATKMYFPMREGPGAMGPSRRNIVRECEASLRRLGVETIDLYQLHHPSNEVPIDETLAALDDLVRAGKVHHVGTSSFAAWQIVESLWAADVRRTVRVATEQPVYNLLDRRIERELAPMATTYDVALLTWSPLAGGALAGRYAPDEAAPADSRFATLWRGQEEEIGAAAHAAIDEFASLARECGTSLAVLSQAWVLSRPEVTCMLAGPRSVEQLEVSLDADAVQLDDDLLEAIDQVAAPGRALVPQYGADGLAWVPWGPHRRRWQ